MKQEELEQHRRSKVEHVEMLKEKIQGIDAKIDRVQTEIAEKKKEIDRVKRKSRERDNKMGVGKADHPIRDYVVYYWNTYIKSYWSKYIQFYWNAYAIPLWETLHSL